MKTNKSIYSYWLTAPSFFIYTVFFMVPVLIGMVMAFTDWNIKDMQQFSFTGLENFRAIFQDPYFRGAILNTLWFALITTIFKVVVGLVLALLLTRPILGRNLYRTIFYMPAVLSSVVVGLIFTSVFQMGGLFDTILALIGLPNDSIMWLGNEKTALGCVIFTEIWQWSGLNMVLFIAGLQGISREYYEAASIDGASVWQRYRHITFPLLAPAFTVVVTTSLIGSLKVFAQVYVLTNGGPGFSTQVLATYIYKAFSAGLMGRSSAMSLVLTVLVTVFSLILNNKLKAREVEG